MVALVCSRLGWLHLPVMKIVTAVEMYHILCFLCSNVDRAILCAGVEAKCCRERSTIRCAQSARQCGLGYGQWWYLCLDAWCWKRELVITDGGLWATGVWCRCKCMEVAWLDCPWVSIKLASGLALQMKFLQGNDG